MLNIYVLSILLVAVAALPTANNDFATEVSYNVARRTIKNVDFAKQQHKKFGAKLEQARKNYETNLASSEFNASFAYTLALTDRLAKRNLRFKKKYKAAGYVELLEEAADIAEGDDFDYFGPVSVGTPQQESQVILDTGSADFWIYGSSVNTTGHEAFNGNKSTTFSTDYEPWNITYGLGYAKGYVAKDVITFGGVITSSATKFALATTADDDKLEDIYDGILGLAFGTISGFYPSRPPFEELVFEQKLEAPYFSFYITRVMDWGGEVTVPSNSTSEGNAEYVTGGLVTLGRLPQLVNKHGHSIHPKFDYVPVTEMGYWEVDCGGLTLDGKVVNGTATSAVIDSGTSLIIVPEYVAKAFYANIGGTLLSSDDGTYTVPFENLKKHGPFGIKFGHKTYHIELEDLIYEYTDKTKKTVILAILFGDFRGLDRTTPIAVVGDTFMKNVLTVFSYSGGTGEDNFPYFGPTVGFYQIEPGTHVKKHTPEIYRSTKFPSPTSGLYKPTGR